MKINVGIIGVSGYTGIEALRILLKHPFVNIKALFAEKNAGKNISDIYPAISGFDLPPIKSLENTDLSDIDVVFCCLPHGTSQSIILNLYNKYSNLKIIDLSADFRLQDPKEYEKWYKNPHLDPKIQAKDVAYGLSEIHREAVKHKRIIACPGCYPTSVILPLFPLLNVIDKNSIIIDSKSGLSGAGRKEHASFLFSERSENVQAYGLFEHRHLAEMQQELACNPIFTPHIVPAIRGILSTIYAKTTLSTKEINSLLQDKYLLEPFVEIVNTPPTTKEVIGTNKCRIYAMVQDSNLIIVSVIDNLYKGSSGQAVQNMNIAFNFTEDTALDKIPLIP